MFDQMSRGLPWLIFEKSLSKIKIKKIVAKNQNKMLKVCLWQKNQREVSEVSLNSLKAPLDSIKKAADFMKTKNFS